MTYENSLQALADPTRRNIFETLRFSPRTVVEIANLQPVSRPAVSQHLKVLQGAGLVSVKQNGTRRYYSIRRQGLSELRKYIDGFWDDVLTAYAIEVEKQTGDRDGRSSSKDN